MADRAEEGNTQRSLAQMYGIIAAVLAFLGLFVTRGHLFELMNADLALDIVRVLLAVALLYAGFGAKNLSSVRDILLFTGVVYVGLAVLGLINSTVWNLLPTGLTGFDIIVHLLGGALAIAVARDGRTEDAERAEKAVDKGDQPTQ